MVSRSSSRLDDPLLYRRQRNKRAEEELHHISENLSFRLEELDQVRVCVCVVCERSRNIVRNVFKQKLF